MNRTHKYGLIATAAIAVSCAASQRAHTTQSPSPEVNNSPGATISAPSNPMNQQGLVNTALNLLSGVSIQSGVPFGFMTLMYVNSRQRHREANSAFQAMQRKDELIEKLILSAFRYIDNSNGQDVRACSASN